MKRINVDQAIQFAIKLEKQGRDFYRGCSESASGEDARKMFVFLAEEESRHQTMFEKMRASHRDARPDEEDAGMPEDRLMDAYADSFFPAQEEFEDKSLAKATLEDVLSFAMQTERNSIQYYEKLKSLLASEHIKVVDRIVREEHKHYEKLHGFRDALKRNRK